ncbi:lysylphosphatidylglycerol synthase transmembrane domain-containing protein [Histidinibacterium lentulum]|uniref:UPF0104 family protein n=1 Tax=Histidinibacterium lentulum TaxID=2480588 RepID=A0A3N2QSA7_9RHOB|nr:lysylphosphatidylglycerol synthase transmembrane domain-containing protein [Histidinibacterium lentulum]ROT98098.1 UPF0104 family protein [Histidinibacterium lentulum]
MPKTSDAPAARSGRGLLRIAVPLGIVILLWQIVDLEEVGSLLGQVDPWAVSLALVLVLVQNAVSALRWRLTAARLGLRIGRGRALSEYFLSQLLNMTLPAGVLGDAGRALRSRAEAGLVPAGQAVVIDRLTGQVALFSVLGAGLVLSAAGPGVDWPDWVVTVVLWFLGAGAALAAALWIGGQARGRIGQLSHDSRAAVGRAVLAADVWPWQAALSLVIVGCNLGAFALCAAATGTVLPFVAVISVVPLILVTMILPVSVGGWGVREGAAAALWPTLGAAAEAGIAASVVFGFVILAASLPGLGALLWPAQAPPRESAPAKASRRRATSGKGPDDTPRGGRDDHQTMSGAKTIGRKTGTTK